MKLSVWVIVSALFLALGITPAPGSAADKMRYITIGSGETSGVYYPAAAAIGKIVNQVRKKYHIRIMVKAGGGSVTNINAVLKGAMEFGIAQSDRQYQAVHGLSEWRNRGPQKKLRAMFSLHPETFFLVAAADSEIKGYLDLRRKSVGVGSVGSGQRQNFKDALNCYGLLIDELDRADESNAARSAKMLQKGRLDAFIYTVGNPAALIKDISAGSKKIQFIPLTQLALNCLTRRHPYYVPAVIPVRFYPGAVNEADPITFAVKATFITSMDVPEDIVYAVTRELFENLDQFKKQHRAFTGLTKKNMLQGLTAPFHPGAIRYFKEAGLM